MISVVFVGRDRLGRGKSLGQNITNEIVENRAYDFFGINPRSYERVQELSLGIIQTQ